MSDRLNRLIEVVVAVLGIIMILVMGSQVVARYVFNHSLFWSEEVGRIILVWLTFLGSTIAYKRKLHIGIDFMVRKLPFSARKLSFLIAWAASFCFFVTFIVLGIKFVFFASMLKTAALGIPGSFTYSVIPLSGLVFIIHNLDLLREGLSKW
ncbi:MAG: TRAP transporter small permease [Thermodesulforhabdaceae bacterium]